MCGIVGLISKRKWGFYNGHADVFKELLFVDTLRGPDSTGVFGVTKNANVSILKAAIPGPQFIELDNFKKFCDSMTKNYVAVIGHNRKATKGSISAKNAHPFKVDDITLVHNGTIWGDKEFKEGVEVDSHQIAHDISEKGEFETIKAINGAYALVWFNKTDKTLNAVRNSQRPLSILETDGFWVLASEAGLAHAVLIRNNYKLLKVHPIPTKTMVCWNMEGDNADKFYCVDMDESSKRDDKVIDISEMKQVETKKEEPKADNAHAAPKSLPAPRENNDNAALAPDEGNPQLYHVVSEHGQWLRDRPVIVRAFDYKPTDRSSSGNGRDSFVYFEVINEMGEPIPDVVGRLFCQENEVQKYIDKDRAEFYVAKPCIIKVPKYKYNMDQRVVLILSADNNNVPRPVQAKKSKNGFFIEKELFGLCTPTGCRHCQASLSWENISNYNMVRDDNGKMRFYCALHSNVIDISSERKIA
jgi:predicted glutamine amidotransferase